MPRRARKTPAIGRQPHSSVAAPWVIGAKGDGPACNDQLDLGQLVQELAEGYPAARLLQTTGINRRLAVSQTDGTIAHELRQPLFAIGMAGENLRLLLARDNIDRDRMKASLARITEQVERAQAIIEQTLLRAVRQANSQVQPAGKAEARPEQAQAADVLASLRRSIEMLDSVAVDHDVFFTCQLPKGRLFAALPAVELEQVLVNVIRNAIESIAERQESGWSGHGRITITLRRSAGNLQCIIADNGVGFEDGSADVLFTRFHTTKPKGGTGLGLHICREIVQKSGGTIQARSRAAVGAEFEIRLPVAEDQGL